MSRIENSKTKAWMYYELGRGYNESLTPNQYNLVNTNIEFFAGNQWINLPETPAMSKLPKPVFNILKRVASLFVASLTSSATTISFEPLTYYDGTNIADPGTNAATYATAEVRNLFEKFKMDYRIREALLDGVQTGDYAAHFYFDADALPYGGAFGAHRGEIEMELIDGINVMYGNPTENDIQRQPYILVVGRDTVGNLREEAERIRKSKRYKTSGDVEEIVSDEDTLHFVGQGGRIETQANDETAKATYVYLYTKVDHDEPMTDPETGEPVLEDILDAKGAPIYEKDENGQPILDMRGQPIPKKKPATRRVSTVHVTKSTRSATIYEDVDTGLSLYPVAFGNWERQKNQYHGRALLTGLLPNQIYLNQMFALIMQHTRLAAFPKTIYNADLIPRWTNEVGQAIAVRNVQPGQSVDGAAVNLRPADMSTQIMLVLDKTMAYTKECIGVTDAQMGNAKLDNTSALMVLQSSSDVPLENTRALLYEWIEDIGAILLDMMGTYYGRRPLVREKDFEEVLTDPSGAPILDPMTGQMQTHKVKHKVIEEFDFSQFKHLWFNTRVDVGATSYYSELATVQTLDNLRHDGTLDTIAYLERVPDRFIPRKDELIEKLEQFQAMGTQAEAQGQSSGVASAMMGELSPDKKLAQTPVSMMSQYNSMPSAARRAIVR
jgi:hypothetical protein